MSQSTQEAIDRSLAGLLGSMPLIQGGLVASTDGYPISAQLSALEAGATSAVVASAYALGARLADLAGPGTFREVVAHSDDGYVVIYAIGSLGVLTVITKPAVNLARLHLNARDTVADLEKLLVDLVAVD